MNQALALFLDSFPSPIGHVYFGRQARNLLLSRILSPAHGHKLIPQSGNPLGRFSRFTMDGNQQHSLLPDCPLRLGSAGPHHYGSRMRLSHLLPKLRHLSRVLS
jgi:hypothetical protein